MTEEQLQTIFDDTDSDWQGDNAFQGLMIISKYISPTKQDLIVAAAHDIIHSVYVKDLLEAGLTEEDAVSLRKLNWMITEYNSLACFI